MKFLPLLLPLLPYLPTAFSQCDSGITTLLCYDYPGAITQDIDIDDVRTIAWYLRWYSHTEGNPRFWTMYNVHNETIPEPLNSTLPVSVPVPGATNGMGTGNVTWRNSMGVMGPTGTGVFSISATGLANFTTSSFNNTGAPFAFPNGTNSGAASTAMSAASASLPTDTSPSVPVLNQTFTALPSTLSTASTNTVSDNDVCMEWTVITRGTTMLLARLPSAHNASVLYDDIAYSLDGIMGSWGSWQPRPADDETKVLVDCRNAGGQIPVIVNGTREEYNSKEFRKAGWAIEGILLKLVHMAGEEEMETAKRFGLGLRI